MPQQQSLEAFLEEIGCPYAAGDRDSVIYVNAYLAGVTRARQVIDHEVEVEVGENVVHFVQRDRR